MVQLLQITPEELANLIKENLEQELKQMVQANNVVKETENDFLTRKQTSEFFQVSNVTLHDWVKKGILHPYKMGNRTYFRKSDLVQKMLESNSK